MSTPTGKLAEKRNSTQSSLSSSNSNEAADLSLLSSNAADYDHIRNTTLMFFLDRLYMASQDGKEARTLHDLSCLFGTKDFTREMRQIVGASRNGLKKFLQSYPSLFTIEGDKVYLSQLRQDIAPPTRDYNREAVDYFTQKLLQFGPSLVPIRNIFGYRSQASQEVRHVSGKNTREFKQFLRSHEDVFQILADEHVILKSALKELESRGESHASIQQTIQDGESVVMDPYLNKQFAHLIEESLERMLQEEEEAKKTRKAPAQAEASDESRTSKELVGGHSDQQQQQVGDEREATEEPTRVRVGLRQLHQRILGECENPLFLKMVKTIEDFRVFLRMHPKIFKRYKCDDANANANSTDNSNSNNNTNNNNSDEYEYVTLLTEEERKEFELLAYPSLSINNGGHHQHHSLSRQHSTLERSNTVASDLSDISQHRQQPVSLPPLHKLTSQPTAPQPPPAPTPTPTTAQATTTLASTNTKSVPSGGQATPTSCQPEGPASALRATAPPFVPSVAQQPKSLQASLSNHSRPQLSNKPPAAMPTQKSLSNLTSSSYSPAARDQHGRQHSMDPRQTLRAHLIKASTENLNNSLYSPSKLSNGAQYQQQQPASLGHQQPPHRQPLSAQNSIHTTANPINQSTNSDDLRARTVDIVREASTIISRIMTTADAVAFDCKGYNLGFNGQITLIQFGFLPSSSSSSDNHILSGSSSSNNNNNNNDENTKPIKPEVCIFDLITNPELAYCLKPLLESDKIVKIVHDVRNKSNALFVQFNIMLNHVFDTQVANLVVQQQETGKPAYKSRYISMSKLCEVYGDETLMKYRNLIKSKTRHSGSQSGNTTTPSSNSSRVKDVNYWRTRPLTDAMIYESTLDVYCLVGGIYQNLSSKIKPEYKPLFEQLNLEGVLARIKPDEIRSVKKERKIDLEVIELKRKLYSDATSSIVLSNREIRLLRHIDLTEKVRQKIQHCKKVAKKLERLDMKAAQAAQTLQSTNSLFSSDTENGAEQSMDPNASSIFSHSSTSTSSMDQDNQAASLGGVASGTTTTPCDQATSELAAISNLMDGSMFDELKDKMIESSSLLESLEDDDDDEAAARSGGHASHSGDCCRCNCHKESSTSDGGEKEKTSLSAKSTHSQASSSSSTPDKHSDIDSIGSKVVDMAIQCDLLS